MNKVKGRWVLQQQPLAFFLLLAVLEVRYESAEHFSGSLLHCNFCFMHISYIFSP